MSVYEVTNIVLRKDDHALAVEWVVRQVEDHHPTDTNRKEIALENVSFLLTHVYAKLNAAVEHGVKFLAQSNQLIAAVGCLRGCSGLGLKEAKLLAEWLRDN